ncbi:MAG: AglZ/HisF2 family acetamidino modification protein [Flavobacteriales bacterium]
MSRHIPRVIPILLLDNKGLYKTQKFKNPKYVGDPLNAVKIFNEKEVDELIFLDINATIQQREPNLVYLEQLASECFMPLCYGGNVRTVKTIKDLIKTGIEKVSINSFAIESPSFIKEASANFGSSTIVVSVDIKKNIFGKYELYNKAKVKTKYSNPFEFAALMNEMGAGELLITSVDKEGTLSGYDLELIKKITSEVDIPVIANGGASTVVDFKEAVKEAGASAVAAGSMFVFHGALRAVLITYPEQDELKQVFA